MPGLSAKSYAGRADKILSIVEYDTNGGCWLWPLVPNSYGYGDFNWKHTRTGAHRAAYEEFCGAIPEGMFVLHRCDVRACCNPAHLFLGTQLDNMRDMHAKGRWDRPRGELHHGAKVTDQQALEIRARRRNGEGQRKLAREYGVHENTIYDIVRRKNFTHLKDQFQ